MKNKKRFYSSIVVVMLCAMVVSYAVQSYQQRYNGATAESRQLQLEQVREDARIVREQALGSWLIAGIQENDGDYGIAIYMPQSDETYKLQSASLRDSGEVVTEWLHTADGRYVLLWLDQPELSYAEVTVTTAGNSEQFQLDATGGRIVVLEEPELNYSMYVAFYDIHGNCFE